jgi:DNA modification methylase
MDMLSNEWDEKDLDDWGLDVWQTEEPEGDDIPKTESTAGSLNERFIVPPFSVLDTRQGYWQKRKKAWREIIGDNGESRQGTLIQALQLKYKDLYQKSMAHRKELGVSFKEYLEKYVSEEDKRREESKVVNTGVSILDPVMAEVVCRWFGIEGGTAFDCFAGDSVFGYVAAKTGLTFTGIELRPEQAALNNQRVADMTARYINDDGQNVAKHIEAESQDLLFSCPPYFDLEVYSDDPKDASNQESYEEFFQILKNAFTEALKCLKPNRFAVVVIGDVRDKKTGLYYNLIDDLKHTFKDAGAPLYNEIILLEQTANSALRAAKAMESRKVVKVHQNILVFYKGDPKHIKDNFKIIEYDEQDLESFGMDFGDEAGEAESDF